MPSALASILATVKSISRAEAMRHKPGGAYQSTSGVRYKADQAGTLRRIDAGPRPTKAEKKALKRARARERRLRAARV